MEHGDVGSRSTCPTFDQQHGGSYVFALIDPLHGLGDICFKPIGFLSVRKSWNLSSRCFSGRPLRTTSDVGLPSQWRTFGPFGSWFHHGFATKQGQLEKHGKTFNQGK